MEKSLSPAKPMPLLVGFCGLAGTGKSYYSVRLQFKLIGVLGGEVSVRSFAHPLRKIVQELFGWQGQDLTDAKVKQTVDPYWGITPRQALQFVGTEMVRNQMPRLVHPAGYNFWVMRMMQSINQFERPNEFRAVVIDDVRFEDEVRWILDNNGILFHLVDSTPKPNAIIGGILNHESEQLAIKGVPQAHTINVTSKWPSASELNVIHMWAKIHNHLQRNQPKGK